MPRTIAFLIFPGFQLLDAAGPISTFEVANRREPRPYRLRIIAMTPGPVESSSGATLLAEAPGRGAIDTLIVAGGVGTREAMRDKRTLAYLRQQAKAVRRLCSVCSGAYILASAGLLEGREATTHWGRSKDFAQRFPNVKLKPEMIHVRDGDIWTSAGITAGIDLSLALVADDQGEAIARAAAQDLVVYYRRPGGQSQFSPLVQFSQGEGRFASLMGWIREHVREDLSVERLAKQAAMSPRNFARAFMAETGLTPAKAVERMRLDLARECVERGGRTLAEIADETGFGDAERMRRAFQRAFGSAPQVLRRKRMVA
jgi:transcriptional regulator GlxA family with amidase domain